MNPVFTSLLSMLALTTESAWALETGNMQGVVEDESGVPVPGAEVIVSGTELAGERKYTTGEDGAFRFDGLAPGTYDVTVLFKGATIARAEVRVALSTTTNVPIPAKMGGVSAEVEVIGYRPAIDTTSSSFGSALSEGQIQNLPVGRSYQDVVETIPGVSGRINTTDGGEGNGNPSVRGEGQYGNNFYIDGVSTRDPATKTFGQNVNFDSIQDIQVYTDGAPAEYGQFTGMVVNVVTKDGGDEHHGSAAVFYSQHAWFNKFYPILDLESAKEVDTIKRRSWAPVFAGTAGGPIIKEKLWYFTSLDLTYADVFPEGIEEGEPIKTRAIDYQGKITWFPNAAWTLRYQLGLSYSPRPAFDRDAFVLPEATSDRLDWDQSHRITATLAPDDLNILELRLGYLNTNLDTVPTSGDELTPSRLDEQGALHTNASQFDYNNRDRFGGSIQYTRLLNNLLGNHKLKAGADAYVLVSSREILNTGRVTDFNWQVDENFDGVPEDVADGPTDVGTNYGSGFYDANGNGVFDDGDTNYPCTQDDFSDCYSRQHSINAGPLPTTIYTYSAFLQDDWEPIDGLTANLGVRADIEDGRNNEGERPGSQIVSEYNTDPEARTLGTFGPIAVFSPRLGFAWDPLKDGRTKFSGHYGWYYDLAGGNLWDWANTRSANGYVRYERDGTGEFAYARTQDPITDPLIYDEDLKPARLEKFNLAIEREVIKDLAIGLRGILSTTKNIPEDVNVDSGLDGSGGDFYITNSTAKKRQYRALELTINKQFDEVWQLYGAYTLSESVGHTPGQFELPPGGDLGSDGNNVGIYLDDFGSKADREALYNAGYGPLLMDYKGLGHCDPVDTEFCDEAGWFGYLPYHSFHLITLNGSYTAPFGTTFGLVYEFDSGHAWQKRTEAAAYGPGSTFNQGRGTRMMPAVHYVDVRFAHKLGLGKEDRSLEATLDIFNLPGFAQSITYFENDAAGFGSTLYRQAPRSVRLGLKMRY